MTTDGPRARHLSRRVLLPAAAAAVLLGVAACGSSGSSAASNGSTSAAGTSSSSSAVTSSSSAASSAVPTQDVVSSIQADPKLTAELPASVQSSKSLGLGTTLLPGTSGLPHAGTVGNSTTYVGVDIDLRNAVAKVLGISWKVENGTFPTIIPGVQNKKYDVGQDNFGVTKAREQVLDFETYLTDGQAFLAPTDSKVSAVNSITDICGLTIGTGSGSTFQQILTKDAPQCAAAGKQPFKVQYFPDTAPIILGLTNGKIDLYFGPTLSLKYDAAHIPGTKFLNQFSSTPVGFVTPKGSPLSKPLSDAVNELIANGDYAKILGKWDVTSSGITQSAVNPAATL